MDKEKYLLAKMNGLAELFRGDEIARRIASRYPLSAQIAVILDKDEKPDEWREYLAFRQSVKAAVDAEIAGAEVRDAVV